MAKKPVTKNNQINKAQKEKQTTPTKTTANKTPSKQTPKKPTPQKPKAKAKVLDNLSILKRSMTPPCCQGGFTSKGLIVR